MTANEIEEEDITHFWLEIEKRRQLEAEWSDTDAEEDEDVNEIKNDNNNNETTGVLAATKPDSMDPAQSGESSADVAGSAGTCAAPGTGKTRLAGTDHGVPETTGIRHHAGGVS